MFARHVLVHLYLWNTQHDNLAMLTWESIQMQQAHREEVSAAFCKLHKGKEATARKPLWGSTPAFQEIAQQTEHLKLSGQDQSPRLPEISTWMANPNFQPLQNLCSVKPKVKALGTTGIRPRQFCQKEVCLWGTSTEIETISFYMDLSRKMALISQISLRKWKASDRTQ